MAMKSAASKLHEGIAVALFRKDQDRRPSVPSSVAQPSLLRWLSSNLAGWLLKLAFLTNGAAAEFR